MQHGQWQHGGLYAPLYGSTKAWLSGRAAVLVVSVQAGLLMSHADRDMHDEGDKSRQQLCNTCITANITAQDLCTPRVVHRAHVSGRVQAWCSSLCIVALHSQLCMVSLLFVAQKRTCTGM
jgi:hypothetical protein